MKKILICTLTIAFFAILNSCDKKENNSTREKGLYALEINEETEWDYMVAGEDKSLLFVKMNDGTSIPQLLTFSYDGNVNNSITATYKENGLPDVVCIDKYILVYSNFRDSLFDIAIINPNNTINYFFDIKSDIDWNTIIESDGNALRSSSTGLITFQHSLKFISTSLSGIACATSGILTVGSLGALTPVMALSCGTFIIGAINSYGFDSSNFGVGLSTTNTVASHVGNLIGCVGGGLSCFAGLASDFTGAASTAVEFANMQEEKINEAKAGLNGNSTNSIIGEWSCNFSVPNTAFPITLRENGTASMWDYAGTWNVTGSNITIRVTYSDSDVTSTVTLNGTINESNNQITGNYSVIETYYTENGTFVMNKVQGKSNAIELKSIKIDNSKRNVLFPAITK